MDLDEDSAADSFFADLHDAVDQQIASPATRYVKDTFDRLVKAGLGEDEARFEGFMRPLTETCEKLGQILFSGGWTNKEEVSIKLLSDIEKSLQYMTKIGSVCRTETPAFLN